MSGEGNVRGALTPWDGDLPPSLVAALAQTGGKVRRSALRRALPPGQARDAADYRVRNAVQTVNDALHELKLALGSRDAARRGKG